MLIFVLVCITWFCNHLGEEKRVVALLLLSFGCLVTLNALWLFITVPWVSLQCVIVVFLDHTLLLLGVLSTFAISSC